MAFRIRPAAEPASRSTPGPRRSGATPLSRVAPAEPPAAADPAAPTPAGKGRPTPKRSQAEAARRRPLVPVDRKAAARSSRAKAKEARDRQYQAMQSGEEKYLPARDRGQVRRWVRDYVDARWNLGEYLLLVSMVMLLGTWLAARSAVATLILYAVLYVIIVATVVDTFLLSRVLKRKAIARFGEDQVPRGTVRYGVMRALQMRRTRLPRPQVARGQYPA